MLITVTFATGTFSCNIILVACNTRIQCDLYLQYNIISDFKNP